MRAYGRQMSIDHVSVSSHLAHQIIGIQTQGEKMSDRDTDNKDSAFQADTEDTASNTHWALIGLLITFQFKLAMDGLRDLLLSPVSIGFVLYGILVQREQPDKYFRRLMRFGRDSDHFINLFGEKQETQRPESSIDDKDREIVLAAVRSDGFAIVDADSKFLDDKEIAIEAIKNNTGAFLLLNKNLTMDEDILTLVGLEKHIKKGEK